METGSTVAKAEVLDSLTGVLKTLADGRRLELVEPLAHGEHSVDAPAPPEAARWPRDHGVDAMPMDEGVVEWRATGTVDPGATA